MFDLVERGRETGEREKIDQMKEKKGREVKRKDIIGSIKRGLEKVQQQNPICQKWLHLCELKWKVLMFRENLPTVRKKPNGGDSNLYIT